MNNYYNFDAVLQEMNCDLITMKQVTSCRAHMKVKLLELLNLFYTQRLSN